LNTLGLASSFYLRDECSFANSEESAHILTQNVLKLAKHLGGQSELVQDWLTHSEIVNAAPKTDLHSAFANDVMFKSAVPLQWSTPFNINSALGYAGVRGHPWMGPVRAAKWADLNNAEMTSLFAETDKISSEVSSSNRDVIPSAAPFPAGPRQAPQPFDSLAFGFMHLSSGIPKLVYVRHFTMGFRNRVSQQRYERDVIGYGYLGPKDRLVVSYVLRRI
jgi:hypothetical protein